MSETDRINQLEQELEAERLLLCKALCEHCAANNPPYSKRGEWEHFNLRNPALTYPCKANSVRKRMADAD